MAGLVRRTIAALQNADLPLDMPGSIELSRSRRQLLTQLESRILPHLESDDLPTIIVFGGSSGAGKSTLVNSLVEKEISAASVLRPTTREPVIAIHPDDERAMRKHSLSKMGRIEVADSAISGVVIVDAPDLDSVDDSNRELSARLLDSADLWVFVTTAARYGDAMAWSTLQEANVRGITCAVVLDRVPQRALGAVRRDLLQRMTELGLAESPLFIIPDQGAHEGLLQPAVVADIRQWLDVIAATKVGNSLVDRTTQATLPQLRADLLNLADALEGQEHALFDLKDKANEGIQAPLEKLAVNIAHGRFGQGAPTTSWLSLASTGGPLAGLVAGRKPGIFGGRKSAVRDNAITAIFDSVFTSVRVALTQGVMAGKANVEEAWKFDIVDTTSLLAEAKDALNTEVIIDSALEGWRSDLIELAKRAPSNEWLSQAGNASLLGVAAGGISGAQKAARELGMDDLVTEAREALATRVRTALSDVVGVYTGVVDKIKIGDSATLRLRASEFLNHA